MNLAVGGGAKDFGSFRQACATNASFGREPYTPLPSEESITHEGLFYEYYFETGKEENELFSAKWELARTKDPFNNVPETYLCCGLNSKYDGEGLKKFGRPSLNLVIALDVSGSMGTVFNNNKENKSLLTIAKECIYSLINNLQPTDSFGLITFNSGVSTLAPLTLKSKTDWETVCLQIEKLHAHSGTDMVHGMQAATSLFDAVPKNGESQNRIMFLTDAKPTSCGKECPNRLCKMVENNANSKIFTTFLGMGIDFGIDLVDKICKIQAANYFTISSPSEFKQLMDDDFDYIVNPACFNVCIKIDEAVSPQLEVERVYGSPGCELAANGILFEMTSAFPSDKKNSTLTKGGIVLIKLKNPDSSSSTFPKNIPIKVTFEDLNGKKYSQDYSLDFSIFPKDQNENFYSGSAIQKGILLTRFVNLMRWFIRDTKQNSETITVETGILPSELKSVAGSGNMKVSSNYRNFFKLFENYLMGEMEVLNDEKLNDILEQIETIKGFYPSKEILKKSREIIKDEDIINGVPLDVLFDKLKDGLDSSLKDYSPKTFKHDILMRFSVLIAKKIRDDLKSENIWRELSTDLKENFVNKMLEIIVKRKQKPNLWINTLKVDVTTANLELFFEKLNFFETENKIVKSTVHNPNLQWKEFLEHEPLEDEKNENPFHPLTFLESEVLSLFLERAGISDEEYIKHTIKNLCSNCNSTQPN